MSLPKNKGGGGQIVFIYLHFRSKALHYTNLLLFTSRENVPVNINMLFLYLLQMSIVFF